MKKEQSRDEKYKWVFAILLSFEKYIKYDYPLPDPSLITLWANEVVNSIKVSDKTKTKIKKELDGREDRDDFSNIDLYMDSKAEFGKEWLYGYGTLYRWRNGFESSDMKREWHMKKYFNNQEQKILMQIQEKIKNKAELYFKTKE